MGIATSKHGLPAGESLHHLLLTPLLFGVDSNSDVKLENLLLLQPGDLKTVVVCDFGFMRKTEHPFKGVVGSPVYISPEVLPVFLWFALITVPTLPWLPALPPLLPFPASSSFQVYTKCQYSPANDTWALGIVLFCLLGGYTPFRGDGTGRFVSVLSGHLPRWCSRFHVLCYLVIDCDCCN